MMKKSQDYSGVYPHVSGQKILVAMSSREEVLLKRRVTNGGGHSKNLEILKKEWDQAPVSTRGL